jgi:hypothetical protein
MKLSLLAIAEIIANPKVLGALLKRGALGRVVHENVEYTAKKFQKFLVGKCNHGVERD